MTERDPELARMLELYRSAKAPGSEVRERVWSAVDAETRPASDASGAPSGSSVLKLVVLGAAMLGLAGLYLRNDAARPSPPRDPIAAPLPAKTASEPKVPTQAAPATTIEPTVTVTATEAHAPQTGAAPTPRTNARPRVEGPLASSLAEELKLLTGAKHAAERGRPGAALTLLDRHARRFPEGAMTEEREAERVAALCALGRHDDAQRVAAAFLARFAGSPQSARISRICAAPEPSP